MVPVPPSHPPVRALEQFATGKLEGAVHAAIRKHALICSACQVVLSAARAEGPESTLVEFTFAPEGADGQGPGVQTPGGTLNSTQRFGPPEALVGQRVGDYVIEEPLGKGGMGIVYKARHTLIGKVAAIKVLRAEVAGDPGNMQALLAEARSAAQVRHASIVDIYALGHLPDGRQYIVMEFLAGESLNTLIKNQGALPLDQALELADRILAALEAAHEAHIVHRDLKPSNLFVNRDRDGTLSVKLLDFGLARQQRRSAGHTNTRGLALGSPAYMSPEQVRGEAADPRADLYALGILLYETLVGTRPFRNSNMLQLMTMQLEQAPVPPRALLATLPLEVDQFVLQLLEKDRAARPASATVARATVRHLRQVFSPPRPSLVDLPRVAVSSGVRPQPFGLGTVVESRPVGATGTPPAAMPLRPPTAEQTDPSVQARALLPSAPPTTERTEPSVKMRAVLPMSAPTAEGTEPSVRRPAVLPAAPPPTDQTEPSGKLPALLPAAPPPVMETEPSTKIVAPPFARRTPDDSAPPAPRRTWVWVGVGAAVIVAGVLIALALGRGRAAAPPPTETEAQARPAPAR